MSQDADHRWTMLEQALNAEAMGYDVKPFVSNRTLFGIRPTAEVILDEYVAKAEAERKAALHPENETQEASASSEPSEDEVAMKRYGEWYTRK